MAPADVVDRLLWTLHGGQTVEESSAWEELARRRSAELESSQIQSIPGEVTSDKIRRMLRR